ncbi:MAG: conjugal transfer protein TraH [bacterium]
MMIIFLSMFFVVTTPMLAQAGISSFVSAGLAGANSTTVTNGGAGVYRTQGGNIYTLGYSQIRFNTVGQNLQLFTISPPSFSIGCSGISATWGAFAMLGSQLIKVLSSLIQSGAVLAFAFNMVLGVLCKQCQTIMNQLEAIANKLNGLNFNSCRTAQAMGNLAGSEIGGMLNKSGVAGATNAFANSVSSTLSNVSSAVGTFVNTINSGGTNCTPIAADATAMGNMGYANCGEAAAAKLFQTGSVLRYALTQAHIGLIDGTTAGTGGLDDLIAIFRGNMVGDIVGYPGSAGEAVVRYVAPVTPEVPQGMGINLMGLGSVWSELAKGSNSITPEVVEPVNPGGNYSYSQVVVAETPVCFPGFVPIYEYYLNQVESSYFNTPVPSFSSSICPSYSIGEPLTGNALDSFVTNSKLPVILVAKLAFVNNDPSILHEAARAMAYGYILNIFSDMLSAIQKNILAGKNLDKIVKGGKAGIFKNYTANIKTVVGEIRAAYVRSLEKMHIQESNLNYYQQINKQWVSSLSAYGLKGNYTFNP